MARRLVNDPNVISSLRVLQQERFAALNQVAQEAQARAASAASAHTAANAHHQLGLAVSGPSGFPPALVCRLLFFPKQ